MIKCDEFGLTVSPVKERITIMIIVKLFYENGYFMFTVFPTKWRQKWSQEVIIWLSEEVIIWFDSTVKERITIMIIVKLVYENMIIAYHT